MFPQLTRPRQLPHCTHAMSPLTRRQFLARNLATAAGFAALTPKLPTLAAETTRKFTMDLSPGAIGVGGDLPAHIQLAKKHGFESVQPDAGYLSRLDMDGIARLSETLYRAGLKWGAVALDIDFRQGEDTFRKGLAALPRIVTALKCAGVQRAGTWLMPGHNELDFAANSERHVSRLREIAAILHDQGVRFGLEYVGTPSLAKRFKHEFVHNLAQARALIAAINHPAVGVVLDSWHWFMAGDTSSALHQLTNSDIVGVDLNDAPAGVAREDQQDGRRELPVATGVIPVKDFLQALVDIGYDGPMRVEPFNKPLNDLDDDAACAQTIAAFKKAVALVS